MSDSLRGFSSEQLGSEPLSQASSKPDSPKPESRLTLNELSPEVKPFATHLSEYILSLCKKHGIDSNLDTTNNINLSQAVSDAVAMYIEKLETDPSLMKDAKKLIQLQNRLTSVHEQNKVPEEQEGDLHLVDLSGDPMPDKWKEEGWEIAKHEGEGILVLDPSELQLYLSQRQQNGNTLKGNVLMDELEKDHVPVLNACVHDYLFNHLELIPEDWKKKGYILFPATQFRSPRGSLYVRCLFWGGGVWNWSGKSLSDELFDMCPSAVLPSVPQL